MKRTFLGLILLLSLIHTSTAATRVFRNTNGLIAVERNGVIVFGSPKVLRATDVTVRSFPTENWVALSDSDLRNFDQSLIRALFPAVLRMEALVNGTALVFESTSIVTELSVRATVAAAVPPITPVEAARQRLITWRTSGDPITRQVIEDVLELIGARQ